MRNPILKPARENSYKLPKEEMRNVWVPAYLKDTIKAYALSLHASRQGWEDPLKAERVKAEQVAHRKAMARARYQAKKAIGRL